MSRLLSFISIVILAACAQTTPPLPDKSTNWLRACDRNAECGSELACLCGVCSATCEEAASCGSGAAASCIRTDTPKAAAACGDDPPTPAVCATTCEVDADCRRLGRGHYCRSGICAAGTPPTLCDASTCRSTTCPPGLIAIPECDEGSPLAKCSCAPAQELRCEPGELNMEHCDFVSCTELNATAVARCGDDGRFGACECVVPREGCAALDCAPGYACYSGRCLETKRCNGAGRACDAGWSCWDGSVCGQVLASDQHMPTSLALADDALYFANRGTFDAAGTFVGNSSIQKVELPSGILAKLADDLNPIGALVVDGESAFWVSEGNPTAFQLMSMPLRDGTPNSIIGGVNVGESLVVDGDSLYWFDHAAGESSARLMRAPKSGSTAPRVLLSHPAAPTGLVIHRDRLYWSDDLRDLWRAERDGNEAVSLLEPVRREQGPRRIAAHEAGVYWVWWQEGDDRAGASEFTEENGPLILGSGREGYRVEDVVAVAVHDQTVFWLIVSSEGYGVLHRTDRLGGETRYVWGTPRLTAGSRIVANADAIFITSPERNEVVRVANRR